MYWIACSSPHIATRCHCISIKFKDRTTCFIKVEFPEQVQDDQSVEQCTGDMWSVWITGNCRDTDILHFLSQTYLAFDLFVVWITVTLWLTGHLFRVLPCLGTEMIGRLQQCGQARIRVVVPNASKRDFIYQRKQT